MKVADQVRKAIKQNAFDEAYSAMGQLSIGEKVDLLFNQVTLEDNTCMYLFLLYLVARDENEAEWNFRCFMYLVFDSSFFDDSMCLAAWHAKNAIHSAPQNVEYKKAVLSVFSGYPEQYFSNKELVQMANAVICVYPDDNDAIEYLSKQ